MWQIISDYFRIIIMMIGVFIFAKIVLDEKIKVEKKVILYLILLISIPQTIITLKLSGTLKTICV